MTTNNPSHYMYFDPNPITDPLELNYDTVKNEFYDLLRFEQHIKNTGGENPALNWGMEMGKKLNRESMSFDGAPLYFGNFKAIPVFLRKSLLDDAEKRDMVWGEKEQRRIYHTRLKQMPFLRDWIDANFDAIGAVTFNIMHPGTTLNHHWGLDRRYLRCHLCFKADPYCVFDIQGEQHAWKEKEIFGFDDGSVLHGTAHRGSDFRIIMLFDVLKTSLRPYTKNWNCRDDWTTWDGTKQRPPREQWPAVTDWKQLEQESNWEKRNVAQS